MALTAVNQVTNHISEYFECVGDGSSTTVTCNQRKHLRSGQTAVTTALSGATSFDCGKRPSGHGGQYLPAGTPVTVSSTSVSAAGVITVTFGSAPTNGTRVYCVSVFGQDGID